MAFAKSVLISDALSRTILLYAWKPRGVDEACLVFFSEECCVQLRSGIENGDRLWAILGAFADDLSTLGVVLSFGRDIDKTEFFTTHCVEAD